MTKWRSKKWVTMAWETLCFKLWPNSRLPTNKNCSTWFIVEQQSKYPRVARSLCVMEQQWRYTIMCRWSQEWQDMCFKPSKEAKGKDQL
jgi:hypothetical protein